MSEGLVEESAHCVWWPLDEAARVSLVGPRVLPCEQEGRLRPRLLERTCARGGRRGHHLLQRVLVW